MSNIIDLSKLPISDGKQVINIIGLNDNGNIIRAENDTYSKSEIDEKVANVKVDLTGYATEQWVKNQDYATNSDVDEEVSDKVGQVNQRFYDYYTKSQVDELISNIDIPEGTGGESGVYMLEPIGDLEGKVEKQIINKNTYENTTIELSKVDDWEYEGSKRKQHNASVIQAYKNGKVKSLFFKYKCGINISSSEQIETETTIETIYTYVDCYVLLPVTILPYLNWDGTVLQYNINGYYQIDGGQHISNSRIIGFALTEDGGIAEPISDNAMQEEGLVATFFVNKMGAMGYLLNPEIIKEMFRVVEEGKIAKLIFTSNDWATSKSDVYYAYPTVFCSTTNGINSYTAIAQYDDSNLIKWYFDGNTPTNSWGGYDDIFPTFIPLGGGSSSEGGAASTIVELSGSKPTLDEFNRLYESASMGIPTYVKYNDGMFAIIADYSSITNRGLYHLYFEDFDTYNVFWYNQANSSSISVVKAKVAHGADGVKNILTPSSNVTMGLYSGSVEVGDLPAFLKTSINGIRAEAPLSITNRKNATMLLDGKMYYWDFTDDSTLDNNGISHKAKVVDLLNISSNGSSEGGSDGVILEYPQNVDNYTYTMNHLTGESEDWETNTDAYVGSERMSKNAELYQRIWNGEVTSVYMKYKYNNLDVSLGFSDDGTKEYYRSEHYYTIIPLSFHKDENENCIIFNSVFSKPYDTTYRLQFILRENGYAYYYDWTEETVGGSSDGTTELHSPVIYGEMQFQEDYGSYEDTASGVACGFKMNRANINNIWVKELHLGTGGETVKVTSPMSNVDGNEEIVYAEFTTTGIKENGQYLSDKYVLKTDYDALLARIEALENK